MDEDEFMEEILGQKNDQKKIGTHELDLPFNIFGANQEMGIFAGPGVGYGFKFSDKMKEKCAMEFHRKKIQAHVRESVDEANSILN